MVGHRLNRRVLCWVVCVSCGVVWCRDLAHSAFAAEPIDIGRALDVIQSFETRIQVVEYHVEVMSAQLSDADDLESVVKRLPGESHAFVRFDPIGRRYYAEFDAVLRASSGQQPKNDEPQFWASKSVYANDGEVFRTWYRAKDGTEIPREGDESAFSEGTIAPASDEVEHVQHEGFLQVYGAQAGIVWMPPFFYTTYEPPQPLSALLRSKIDKGIPVSVVAQHDNIWIITTQTSPGPFDATLEMQYDVSKGCVVRATWANGSPQVVYKRLETKLCRVDGFWAPAEVNLVATLGAARLDRCTFLDVAFNKPVTDADFRLTFPKGVRLNDYIEKKYYITGSGISDDQKAIREFMVRHALKPPNREQPPTGARETFRRLLVINGVGLLALVAFLVYRRRKVASVLIAASLGLCPNALWADELLPDGNWVVSYSPGERIYKSQCGFLATVFALEYLDIDYNARHVSNGLRPTKAGILFADIQRMLEAHGLQAVARQQVTADDLAGALKPNTLAILALSRRRGGSHYFVAVLSQNGRPVLVDVLKKAYPLPETLKDPAVKDEPPVRVQVVLVRRPFYKLSESTMVLSPNEAGRAIISPTSSTGESNPVTVLKIWSIPSGLVLESQEQEDGAVVIGVRAADSVKPGIYVVKCNLVSSVGERATGSFVVRLKDPSDAKPARTASASDSTDDDQ